MTPTLAGDGVVLRPLTRADAPALFAAHGDADVQKYRQQAAHADVGETERYIDETLAKGLAWAITEDGGEALGRIALRVKSGAGEFGIVLRRAAHGRGLASKALALTQGYAFGVLGLRRLSASIDAENAASLALFARAGFAREALLPAHWRTHLGQRDAVIMSKEAAA